MPSRIAIIPARGGSKRIPGKNIRPFFGKPLIHYSIKAALESRCFDEVMVSTDDGKIRDVALSEGAKVPFPRSADTADDYATTADVLIEVLENYRAMGRHFDYVCCIYPTAPFVTAERIEEGWRMLFESHAHGVMPVAEFEYPIQRAVEIRDGCLRMIDPVNLNKRSQDLPEAYHDAGQFYWLKTDRVVEEKRLLLTNTIPFILPPTEVQDIDTEEDWKILELKWQLLQNK